MKYFVASIRGLFIFPTAFLITLPGMIASVFTKNWLPVALKTRRLWAKFSVFVLGIQLKLETPIPQGGPYIYVGNHRSYLDPIITLGDVLALPVAKAEVGSWPIIGYAARMTGIMYVKRESRDSRADTLKAMEKTLKNGFSVLVYPEGTTHIEDRTRDFKKGAFGLAAEMGIPILPIALDYPDKSYAWIGDETFPPHFLRCYGQLKRSVVHLAYGEPIIGNDANELVERTRGWIDERLEKWNGQ